MTINAVLFDLDGTLLDTAPDFIAAINQLTDHYKLAPIAPELIRQQVSQGGRALTQLTFNLTQDDPDFAARHQHLLDSYQQTMGKHCRLFPGMDRLLQTLREHSVDWGIITNKPARFAEPLVAQLPLPSSPTLLLCPDHVSHPKPHPAPLFAAAEHLQCDPGNIIYIGDHQRDIECGINAGSTTIAVAYGYLQQEETVAHWRADFIAEHVAHIWPIIKDLL